ncbi:MAG: DUF1289 domain-containing protein [Halomonas subglaciescola]|nr:DUF1289 domain-containing protein [Halomonas subglaciescola]
MPATPPQRPLSPCVQICQMRQSDQTCRGCGRTLDEIACWSQMTETEKAPVWERLEKDGYAAHKTAPARV